MKRAIKFFDIVVLTVVLLLMICACLNSCSGYDAGLSANASAVSGEPTAAQAAATEPAHLTENTADTTAGDGTSAIKNAEIDPISGDMQETGADADAQTPEGGEAQDEPSTDAGENLAEEGQAPSTVTEADAKTGSETETTEGDEAQDEPGIDTGENSTNEGQAQLPDMEGDAKANAEAGNAEGAEAQDESSTDTGEKFAAEVSAEEEALAPTHAPSAEPVVSPVISAEPAYGTDIRPEARHMNLSLILAIVAVASMVIITIIAIIAVFMFRMRQRKPDKSDDAKAEEAKPIAVETERLSRPDVEKMIDKAIKKLGSIPQATLEKEGDTNSLLVKLESAAPFRVELEKRGDEFVPKSKKPEKATQNVTVAAEGIHSHKLVPTDKKTGLFVVFEPDSKWAYLDMEYRSLTKVAVADDKLEVFFELGDLPPAPSPFKLVVQQKAKLERKGADFYLVEKGTAAAKG